MYELNPEKRSQIVKASKPFSVLAEIKTYLQMLMAEGKIQMLCEIQCFTQSFGVVKGIDFGRWTIEDYIQNVNKTTELFAYKINEATEDYIQRVKNLENESEIKIKADRMFGMAMPPHVLKDYLERVWQYDTTLTTTKDGILPNSFGIVGVKDTTKETMKLYDGLCHYMYKSKDGHIYSWGNQHDSIEDANSNYQVVRFLELD
jgi:hypothetical protein